MLPMRREEWIHGSELPQKVGYLTNDDTSVYLVYCPHLLWLLPEGTK
jgi:hypothetical protein